MDYQNYQKFLAQSKLQPNTIKIYLWHLRHFCAWLGKQNPTSPKLQTYYNYLLKKYKKINTINLRLVILNHYLAFSKIKYRFDLLTTDKISLIVLSRRQLSDFLNKPLNKNNLLCLRDKSLLEIMYYSGLKPGQIINLKTSDLNLQKNYLKIAGRKIILPEMTKIYLLKYLNKRIDDSPYLFINLDRSDKNTNRQLSVRSVERILEKYASKMQPVLKITPQILRNTLAYHLKKQGVDVNFVQNNFDFQSKSAAENYYKKL